MSNLDKLLKKLAGSDDDSKILDTDAQEECIDPVYVEKLASAVEFLLSTELLTKEANLGKIKALLAQGMGVEEAVRKAYPEWSDEQVAALVQKLSGEAKPSAPKEGAPKEGAPKGDEEAEKAASLAGDRLRSLLAERREQTKTASKEPDTEKEEFDFSDKVRAALKEKIAAGANSKSDGDFEFINSVLQKLQTLAASSEKSEEVQESTPEEAVKEPEVAPKEASAGDEVGDNVEEASTVSEEIAKSASSKLNLAEMLKAATSEKAASESVSDTNTETANEHQSKSLTDMLRNSILRKAHTQVEV